MIPISDEEKKELHLLLWHMADFSIIRNKDEETLQRWITHLENYAKVAEGIFLEIRCF
mgnify:CR=1 FL=1